LDHRNARGRRGEQRDPPGMAETQRAADVFRVEDVLDRHTGRTMLCEQRGESFVDGLKAARKWRVRRRGQRSAGNKPLTAALRLDTAVAGTLGAGIDPEDEH